MPPQTTSTSCSSGSPGSMSGACAASGWSSGRWAASTSGTGPVSSWVAGRSTPATRRPRNRRSSGGGGAGVRGRVEADLRGLLDQVISEDFPFLGACYGIGALGGHQGAVVDRRYAEPVGTVTVSLTPEGQRDPLLGGLPATFDAFTGHKEAISHLPRHALLLATSPGCPVQTFRIGSRVYATQFHPELDAAGLSTRIDVYKDAGYFPPAQADELKARAARRDVVYPHEILRHFARRFARNGADAAASGAPAVPRGAT